MSLYELAKTPHHFLKKKWWGGKLPKMRFWGLRPGLGILLASVLLSSVLGFFAGIISGSFFYFEILEQIQQLQSSGQPSSSGLPESDSQESAIVEAAKSVSPAVVSIVISKDMPIVEEYYIDPFEEFFGDPFFEFKIPQYRQKGVEKQQIGGGTGFIVSKDGLILTNKHVVLDEEAEYTVLTNDGQKFSAQVLDKDPFQDLAIIKISKEQIIDEQGQAVLKSFPMVKLGDSDRLQPGQTVVAIGNALGEFRNTISVGVISGLGRTITASGGGLTERIEDVIQTDAAINRGNSGGPLLNLAGEVIGINVAMAETAQNIGFAIPINYAKKDIEQIKTLGRIAPPFLGIYYTLITEQLQKEHNLPVDYGAWVGRNDYGKKTDTAIFEGSAADKAGLQQDDIILEFGGQRITAQNSLKKIIRQYNPGDTVVLKILRQEQKKTIQVVLGELSE